MLTLELKNALAQNRFADANELLTLEATPEEFELIQALYRLYGNAKILQAEPLALVRNALENIGIRLE